jgi:hypothetical protein
VGFGTGFVSATASVALVFFAVAAFDFCCLLFAAVWELVDATLSFVFFGVD